MVFGKDKVVKKPLKIVENKAVLIEGFNKQTLDPLQEAEKNKFRWDTIKAFQNLIHIRDRDKRSNLIKFNPRWIQLSMQEEINKIRAFKLTLSIVRGGPNYRAIVCKILNIFEIPGFKALCNEIVKFNPLKFQDTFRALDSTADIECNGFELMEGKPRQIGATTFCAESEYIDAALNPLITVGVFSYDEKSSKNIFSNIRTSHILWPDEYLWLRPDEMSNSQSYLELSNGSKFEVHTVGSKTNRSWFYNSVHFDEYAHYDSYDVIDDIMAGIPKHCNVFKISTAIGPTGRFYEDWQKCFYVDDVIDAFDKGEVLEGWDEFSGFKWFQPWFKDPGYQLPLNPGEAELIKNSLTDYEEALLAANPEVTLSNLKWRRAKIKKYADKEIPAEQFFAQEFPATEKEMFQPRGNQPFDIKRIEILEQKTKKLKPSYFLTNYDILPIRVHPNRANLTIWEVPQKNEAYLGGVDVAYGKGETRDATVAAFFRRTISGKLIQVAEYDSKLIDPIASGHIITMLARWYRNAYLGIESNGPGESLILTIFNDNGYSNILKRKNYNQFGDTGNETTWELGIQTSPTMKYTVIHEAIFAFREGLLEIRSQKGLDELRNFQQDDKGRYTAPPGKNDDRVMAYSFSNFIANPARGAPSLLVAQTEKQSKLKEKIAHLDTNKIPDSEMEVIQKLMKRIEKINKQEAEKEKKGFVKTVYNLFEKVRNPFE